MKLRRPALGFLLMLAGSSILQCGDFVTGQAPRAVLGQSSFSSHEPGVSGIAMSVSGGKLYVADASGKLLTFDITGLPSLREEAHASGIACAVCGSKPIASVAQRVAAGAAGVSMAGKTEAAIAVRDKEVMIWRDVTVPGAAFQPDISLRAGDAGFSDPISVALDGKRLFVGDGSLHRIFVWNTFPTRNDQPPDAILGSSSTDGMLSADTLLRPEALVSDGLNLYVADSLAHRVLVFAPGDAKLRPEQVINSATLLPGPLAGGTLISISGRGLSESTLAAVEDGSAPLPKKLAGVQVVFNGVPLPLISVSPEEVRAQLIYAGPDTATGSLYIRTEHVDNTVSVTNPATLSIAAASPGIFAFAGDEPRPGVAFWNDQPISTEQPAKVGDTVKLWTTGFHVVGEPAVAAGVPFGAGELAVSPVTALVNGQPAEVVNVSMPATSIGIYEVLVRLPVTAYPDQLARITLTEDGVSSNAVTLPISR